MEKDFLYVYYALIPENLIIKRLSCEFRQKEIESTDNEKVKREKYFSFELLSSMLKEIFNKDISEYNIYKNENGKIVCDNFYLSISHSNGLFAVAISSKEVGVDIERVKSIENLIKKYGKSEFLAKILSENESYGLENLTANQITEIWTKKESLFKTLSITRFIPSKISTLNKEFYTKNLTVNGENFVLTVHSKNVKNIQIVFKN